MTIEKDSDGFIMNWPSNIAERLATAERLLRELGTRDDTMAGLFVDRKRHIENCWCGFPIEDVIDGQRNQVEHEPLCQRIRAFLEPPR